MIRIITLDKEQTATLNDFNPCVIADDEELQIEINSKYAIDNAVLVINNNQLTSKLKLKKVITIPKKFIFAGYLNLQIILYIDGIESKKWYVPPIVIKEIETNKIELIDKITDLEARLKALEDKHKTIFSK